jgi:hypothetical protein
MMHRPENGAAGLRRYGAFAVILALLMLLSACGAKTADLSAYGDTPIEISGLTDQDFTVTPNELAKLKCVSRTATGESEKAGTVDATGPLLNTFLAQYHCQMSDFYKIRFLCADQYKVVLKGEYLTDYEVVMAISGGGKPLDKAQQPLRILIPEAESSMWAYSVVRIEFERTKS